MHPDRARAAAPLYAKEDTPPQFSMVLEAVSALCNQMTVFFSQFAAEEQRDEERQAIARRRAHLRRRQDEVNDHFDEEDAELRKREAEFDAA